MRVVSREYDIENDKRLIRVELTNGRFLTFRMAADDPRFFDNVSEADICKVLRPLIPEEWSMNSDTSKVL